MVLAEAVAMEVSLVPVAGAIGLDEGRSNEERMLAWLAVFTLGLRNAAMAAEKICQVLIKGWEGSSVVGEAYSNRLQGRQGLAVVAAFIVLENLRHILALLLESAPMRASAEKTVLVTGKLATATECTAARCQDYLTGLLDLTSDEDPVLAAGASFSTILPLMSSGATCAGVYIESTEYIAAMVALLHRFGALNQPAAWWKERSARVNLDAVLIDGPYVGLVYMPHPRIPSGSIPCEELLAESIHMLKINKQAELSAQPQVFYHAISTPARVILI
eukprot:COSAG01_NODE_22894_length_836_cov_4.702849_1_plen_274_part_01